MNSAQGRTRLGASIIIPVLLFLAAGCATKVAFPGSPVVPAAKATAKLTRDSNGNTKIRLKVEHLAPPDRLFPPRKTYVVWIQLPDNTVVNFGKLEVDDNLEAEISGITPYKQFRLLVSAEDEPTTKAPGPQVVLSTELLEAK